MQWKARLASFSGRVFELRQGYVSIWISVAAVSQLVWLFLLLAPSLPSRLSQEHSQQVLYSDGEPAFVFLSEDEKFRMPVKAGDVAPEYVEALLRFEDKRFYLHGGVDPIALGRAVYQNLAAGSVTSGASTITQQLVRVLEPRPRTLRSKLAEMFRALQIEVRLSKTEILDAYVTFVPFGRNLEGVEAASWSYFGHSPASLSAAEIATLLAVPQSPTRRYPSVSNRQRLAKARDEIGAWLEGEGLLRVEGSSQPEGLLQSEELAQEHLANEGVPLAVSGRGASDAFQTGKGDPGSLVARSIKATPVPDRLFPLPRDAAHAAFWLKETDGLEARTQRVSAMSTLR